MEELERILLRSLMMSSFSSSSLFKALLLETICSIALQRLHGALENRKEGNMSTYHFIFMFQLQQELLT